MEPVTDAHTGDAWPLTGPEPTNLLAFIPEDEAPTLEDVLTRLPQTRLIERIPRSDDPEIRWCAAVEVAGREGPVVVWCEPARPGAATIGDDASAMMEAAALCRWVLGIETILDESDPLTDFAALAGTTIDAAPSARAVLDVNTTRWHMRDEIDARVESGIEPPADVLFTVQVVAAQAGGRSSGDPDGDARDVAWVHTHGLWRCGRPELEMLDVPLPYVPVAAALVSDVAALILEEGAAAPGSPLEVGHELTVTLQPWQAVAPFVGPGAPGGVDDRASGGDDAHAGARAVICGSEPEGRFKKIWSWPRDVVDRLARGEAGLYQTIRATERQIQLARASWSDFIIALAETRSRAAEEQRRSRVDFSVKAAFRADENAGREHLWFEAHRLDGERVEGELVNEPVDAHGMSVGDRRWIEPSQVSDWLVTTVEGSFGPGEGPAMRNAIERLRSEAGDA